MANKIGGWSMETRKRSMVLALVAGLLAVTAFQPRPPTPTPRPPTPTPRSPTPTAGTPAGTVRVVGLKQLGGSLPGALIGVWAEGRVVASAVTGGTEILAIPVPVDSGEIVHVAVLWPPGWAPAPDSPPRADVIVGGEPPVFEAVPVTEPTPVPIGGVVAPAVWLPLTLR